ncbi:MAG: sugar ABC transporter permease, partial [Clostridia bacterium]|nr:sugar ABC transporter permease [Clostridia bacterium]
LLMSQMFSDTGIINVLLQQWGITKTHIPFLTDGNWAKATIIIVNIWIGIPYTMLICTGILMNIPEDLYESARIDGAGPVKAYMKITLPYMLHVTTPYLISQFIGNLNNFNVIYLLTGGAPLSLELASGAGETDLLITWLYKLTMDKQSYGIASVISILMFIITAVVSLIVYNRSGSVKNEEDFM